MVYLNSIFNSYLGTALVIKSGKASGYLEEMKNLIGDIKREQLVSDKLERELGEVA